MQQFTLIAALLCLVYVSSGSANVRSQPGVCRYGRRLECCYGWKKNGEGQCEAQCTPGCKHGECVGPNKCKCFAGYAGKTCHQDLNECGLKPRPCEHRCMNTYGSYMCYCLNGYMLKPDGSCANSRTCSLAHCQYGCEEVQGEIRCLCPSSGLQLGADERTCVDIDECVTGKNLCPFNRQCINTFGSYLCKCQNGYDLKFVAGKYDCVAVPEAPVRPTIPDPERIKNLIPEPAATEAPRGRQQPFDYEGEVYIGPEEEQRELLPEEEQEEEEEEGGEENNQLGPRGDVFVSEFESLYGPSTEIQEIPLKPVQEEFILDCNFDQGACEWVQDKSDDTDWSVAYHERGDQYYMAMSGLLGNDRDVSRLKLLLSDRAQQGSFCLTFDFRVAGEDVGTLRVLLDADGYAVWEQGYSRAQGWQTELLTVAWKEEAPESIIFEAQRGSGVGGEIGLDNVVLTSGSCQVDDDEALF
ncbi:epidermal growth factor-like protein 6 isoform X4 [Gadus morhua]|uniref:epidermal growth factor-like protein 6 isoform X4 n=1 Tax=Gadus morhua TaxID=8049 RepID=UPI0011B7428F|nr:epidermal growth factor-like protein 6 isoform X4 [Gadus morhua]